MQVSTVTVTDDETVERRMPPMDSTFDIFKVTSDGPLWVEAVQGLEKS